MKLTKKQKKNCHKMADFLESLPSDHLDMTGYVSHGPTEQKPSLECGSVCCVLGWTPAIFNCEKMILDHSAAAHKYRYDYLIISKRIYGVGAEDEAWDWLFDGENPNNPRDMAERLRYWADHEAIEDDYDYDYDDDHFY